jgi:hypothetical protein
MITDKLFTFLKDPKIVKCWYPSGGTNFAALNYWSKNIGNEIQPKHFIFTDGQYLKEHFNMYLLSISKLFNVDINKITSEIIETNLQSYPNTEDPEFQNWIEKKIKLWMDFGSEDEIELKQMGFPKINEVIDSFKTQYSREKNASLLYFCVNDISIGLNIPFSKAEDIKKKFANLDHNFYETLNKINMGDLKLDRNKAALNIRLYSIVSDRVKELLSLVKEKIEAYGFLNAIPCGIVITGGTSNLKGINALAESMFNMPARTGICVDIEGPSEAISNPAYSTAAGLLKYANQIKNFIDLGQFDDRKQKSRSFAGRFRDFIFKVLGSSTLD